jgi:hypothetical protein
MLLLKIGSLDERVRPATAEESERADHQGGTFDCKPIVNTRLENDR